MQANSFVEAASYVCDESRRLGMYQCAVTLHFIGGPVALTIENFPIMSDDLRMFSVSKQNWDINPIFSTLRSKLGPHGTEVLDASFNSAARQYGYEGPAEYPFVIPVIGPDGWFGAVVFGHTEPITLELERSLTMLATRLSVWCTDRGIGGIPAEPIEISDRQYQIGELVAHGLTNAEIADELGISINTVKIRLKQLFARVDANSRGELANVIRRLAPMRDVPPGITRQETVTITRGPISMPSSLLRRTAR